MYYFIFMVGEYEDRDPVFMSSNFEEFKQVVKTYIENWYANGCKYMLIPDDITVMKENHLYKHFDVKRFNIYKIDNIRKFNELFEDIKNYVEEK